MFVVWGLLIVHYILALWLRVPFDFLADIFAPYLSDLPIFDRLDMYYMHNPEALAQARAFYLVNNGVLFLMLAIGLINALIDVVPTYRKMRRQADQCTDQEQCTTEKQNEKLGHVGGVLLLIALATAVILKLCGYTELPEQGVARGVAVIAQFFLFLFISLIPTELALFASMCSDKRNWRNNL